MMPLLRLSIIALFLLIFWQIFVNIFALPDYILPTPLNVFMTLIRDHSLLSSQLQITLIETTCGFVLGVLFGILAGFLIAYFKPLNAWFFPILIVSQAIPTFAIAPLIVIWLGYGLASKIAVTVIMIFFPVTSAFYDGLRRIDPKLLDLASTMQATRWRLYLRLLIPNALPQLASGIRIAAVTAPIGAIVGEWVGSSSGLGYLMLNANARMQIDQLFATLLIIIFLALLLYFIIDKLLRVCIWWQT